MPVITNLPPLPGPDVQVVSGGGVANPDWYGWFKRLETIVKGRIGLTIPGTVTPEQFGYTNYGAGDAGPYIQAAIDSVPGPITIDLSPSRRYRVVTPVVVNKFGVWIRGGGFSTLVDFAPSSNNQSLFKWYDPANTTGIYYGGLTHMRILSLDTTFTKTAADLVDIGDLDISHLTIGVAGQWTNGADCVGLKTAGRQTTNYDNIRSFADKPILLAKNPNHATLATDHFNFSNCHLIALAANPCITVDPDVVMPNLSFSGFQAWIGGTHGFYYNGNAAIGRGYNLKIGDVRREGNISASDYNIFIAAASGLVGVALENSSWDSNQNGLYARGCRTLSLREIYHPAVTAKVAFDIDPTDKSVLIQNCGWESGSTKNIGALLTQYAYYVPSASATVPSNALYTEV